MVEIVHENTHYRISVDSALNLVTVKPIGFWRSPEVVPHYLMHIKDTISTKTRPNFMALVDASDMLTHPRVVQEEIHLKGMALVQGLSPSTMVVVMPQDDISVMQTKHLGKMSKAQFRAFPSMAEAERFLEDYAKENNLI